MSTIDILCCTIDGIWFLIIGLYPIVTIFLLYKKIFNKLCKFFEIKSAPVIVKNVDESKSNYRKINFK